MKGLLALLMLCVPAIAAAAEPSRTPEIETKLRTLAVPRVIDAGAFVYVPSPVTGSAAWTAEYITAEDLAGHAKRQGKFRVDPAMPGTRVNADDYRGFM